MTKLEKLGVRLYRQEMYRKNKDKDWFKKSKARSNKKYRENNREYHLERKRQYYIRKRLGEDTTRKEVMKRKFYTREDFTSDKDHFVIHVETSSPVMRGALEIMNSAKDKEIVLRRGDYATGPKGIGVSIRDDKELAELMMLLSDFAEVLEREKKNRPQLVTEEVQERSDSESQNDNS